MVNNPHPPLQLPPPTPLLIVLSGPSGVGKDAVLTRLKRLGLPLHFAVTATTRPRRSREVHRTDYYFVTPEEFSRMAERGELLEKAQVYGHWYGVPKDQIEKAFSKGLDVLVRVDVQGAATIKSIAPGAVLIFLAPSSLEELVKRLGKRNTESQETISLRLERAQEEMEKASIFDYVVVNRQGKLWETVAQIQAIITAEKCRVTPRGVSL